MSITQRYTIKKLLLAGGKCPFDEWFERMDENDQIMVDDRLARVRQGSFGEINSVCAGVWELKFRKGRALRIYYGQIGRQVLLLIVGGDKRTQEKDIDRAKELFRMFKNGVGNHEEY